MRRSTFLLAAIVFLVACVLLYNSLDSSNAKRKDYYESSRVRMEEIYFSRSPISYSVEVNLAASGRVGKKGETVGR